MMAIDLRDGVYGPPLRPPEDEPELTPAQKAAQAREQADEDAMFVAASRARLVRDQARAFRDGAEAARKSGGVGFAGNFVDGFREGALETAARAQAPDFPGPRPSEQAVGAFLDRAHRDAGLFLDRAAAVETVSRAVKRQKDGLAALDDIRQSAFDDPDGARDARERQDEVIAALLPDQREEVLRPLREAERMRLAEAAVQGRIAAAPHEAMRELDEADNFPDLSDDRRAALKESAARRMAAAKRDADSATDREARRVVLDIAAAERRFSAAFLSRAETGEATDAELEDAVDRGAITRARAQTLRTTREEADSRRQDRLDQVTSVQQAVDTGEPLDPADPDHMRAVEIYWEDITLPNIRDTPPMQRPAVIVGFLRDMLVVPQGLRRAMRAMWDSGDPDMRHAVAETFRLAHNIPTMRLQDALVTEFSLRDRHVQARALDLIDIGLAPGPAFNRAEEIVIETLPAPERDRPLEFTPLSGEADRGAAGEGGETPGSAGGEEGGDASDGAPQGAEGTETDQPPTGAAPEADSAEPDDVFGDDEVGDVGGGAQEFSGNEDITGAGSNAETEQGAAPAGTAQEPHATGPGKADEDGKSENPWERPPISPERRRKILALLRDVSMATEEKLPELEKTIREEFGDSPKFAAAVIENVRNFVGAGVAEPFKHTIRRRARLFLDKQRRAIADGQDYDPQRPKDFAAFAKFERTTPYRIRRRDDGRLTISRNDGEGEPVSVSPTVARFIAGNADLKKLELIHDLVSGRVSGDELMKRAEKMLVTVPPEQFATMSPFVTGVIEDRSTFEAFVAAKEALDKKPSTNRAAIMAALVPAVFPEIDRDPDALKNLILDMLPIVGEIRAAQDAVKQFDGAIAALQRDDLEAAVELGLKGFLSALGAVPAVGDFFRPARAVLSRTIRRTPGLRVAQARYQKFKAGRLNEKEMASREPKPKGIRGLLPAPKGLAKAGPEKVFGKEDWNLIHPDKQKLLKGLLPNIFGTAGEKEAADMLKRGGYLVRTRGRGTQKEVTVKVLGKDRIYDQITEDELAAFFSNIIFLGKRRPKATAIEVKVDKANIPKRQARRDEAIDTNQGGGFVTESQTQPIPVGAVQYLRLPSHQISKDQLEEVARKMFQPHVNGKKSRRLTQSDADGYVETLLEWHRMSQKDTITLGEVVAALAVGVAVRASTSSTPAGPATATSPTSPP